MPVIRKFTGEFSNEEVFGWIDEVFRENAALRPRRIRVSNSLHDRGISGRYNDVPIAMNPEWYPDDNVEVTFYDEQA